MINHASSTILVTGAAGFIGSHVCDMLLKNRNKVIGLDNFDLYYPRAEKEKNIRLANDSSDFTLIEGDIRDAELTAYIYQDHDIASVIHLAARAGVQASIFEPELCLDVNVRGSVVQLEAARKAGVKRFIFASSSSVYGDQSKVPFSESDVTARPLSPYGASKKAGETLCYSYHHLYGMSIACMRFFTVYGPRQRPDLAIRKFAERALADKLLPVYGDGSSRRDYTHINDILSGISGAINWCSATEEPRYGIFNLGSSNPITLKDLLDFLAEYLRIPLKQESLPFQSGDVFQTYADTSLAERELGFRHSIPFEEGLADFCRWLKNR